MSFEARDLMVDVLPASLHGAAAANCTPASPTPTTNEEEIDKKKKKDVPACDMPSCELTQPPPIKVSAMYQLPSLAALRQQLQAALAAQFDAATAGDARDMPQHRPPF